LSTRCPVPKKPAPKKRKKKPPRKKGPKQYRRKDWEDGGGIDDDGQMNPIAEPSLFRPVRTILEPGPAKVAALALRHSLRAQLWHEDDVPVGGPVDYVQNFSALAIAMKEACLAERGVRWAADGIKEVPGPRPGDPIHYRAQIWNPNTQQNEHLGYAKTRDGAVQLIADWYRRYCGIDTRVEPPTWLRACLSDAFAIQSEQSDAKGGMAWGIS